MKKTVYVFLFLFAILTVAKAQQVVKVGAFNFYPAIFQDTDGVVKGFYVDALNELGKKENLKFVYIYGSWDEGLERIKTGEVDILTSVAITEERLKFLDYSATPLLTVWSEVYVNPKSEIDGILDLEGKTIAVMKSDFNGGYLKLLTEKLNIKCEFVETADFEEVFKLISQIKVDAGVVNNTFGVPKSDEFGLLSSGIIFNPFDIFFAVKKGSNEELLKLLNNQFHNWRHDRTSVFNTSRQKWSHGNMGSIIIFPKWLSKAIYTSLFLFVLLILFVVLLRYRVKIATEKVKYSELLFKTFMENTPGFVYIKDVNLNHIYRNLMVDRVNKSAPNDINSSAKTVFEPHIAEVVEKADKEILSLEKKQLNLQYQCKLNGEYVWLHDYKFYLKQPNGKPAIGGISFDITTLKDTELELIKAKEKAEEGDRLKSAFLANMSHEIRTPMNGILGFAELLKEPGLTGEEQKEYIRIIEKSGARMLNTINDIVDISKIESGLMKLDIKEANVNEQIEYIYNFFKLEAEVKGLWLSFKKSLPATEAIIQTDKEKLYAILTNLVKNAIKYTEKGSIEFGYDVVVETRHALSPQEQNTPIETRHALSPQQPHLQFYVRDTGIGIPTDRQTAIFDRFVQADIEDKKAHQGSGLGLAITKSYVEMLGGEIRVESMEGNGSTFYFTLPYRTKTQEVLHHKGILPAENTNLETKSSVTGLKILIAEDDETSKMFMSILAKSFSREILKVCTGLEAIDLCRDNPDLDLILMDIQMPEMGGYEATRHIRQFNKKVVIIAQTAYGLSGDRNKSIQAGCNDYISKPINIAELTAKIQLYF